MNYQKSKRIREYLTREEINKLLSTVKEGATRNAERDHAILTILANHGLRVSELCDLRTSDITLAGEPTIYIRHEKGGGASAQPLYKSDLAALRKWLAIRASLELDHDFLFVSEQRKQINRATINLMVSSVVRKPASNTYGPILTASAMRVAIICLIGVRTSARSRITWGTNPFKPR